jgi:hypothetical protein
MRSTANPAPIHNGKRRLLESCAIVAGLAALAYGGPALAQVAGTGQGVTGPGLSNPTISPPGPGPTTVNTTGDQTIINWTPSNPPVGGVIDFLPTGNSLNFTGTGQYIVLNRFVSGAGVPIADQIAINGTVNGIDFATSGGRGGNIWFYNAGGILIGATGVINVGSLVLTANDVLTTGGLLGPSGEIRFRGAAGGTSNVTVAAGAAINADNPFNPGDSYVALVAPRIVQAGAVRVDGSAAYVAAEQADIRINNGLFDINVLVGAEGGNVITHSGTTTGPAHQQGDIDQSRIYMVAIPKNDAVTMLVSGQVGYEDAVTAQTDPDGAVVLSAGYNVVNGQIDGSPVGNAAANITVNDTIFLSDTTARASGTFLGQPLSTIPTGLPIAFIPPQLGRIAVQGNALFIGDAGATINVNAGRAVSATGDMNVRSGGNAAGPGAAAVNVTGGAFGVLGDLVIEAGGVVDGVTGDSDGGDARLTISGGAAQVGGLVTIAANATGGDISTQGSTGGSGRAGSASLVLTGGAFTASDITVSADGIGGDGLGSGGLGIGGTATIDLLGGTIDVADLIASASGTGGQGLAGNDGEPTNIIPGGVGGVGAGGQAAINIDGATVQASLVAAYASGQGGEGGGFNNIFSFSGVPGTPGDGGTGNGGSAAVNVASGTLDTGSLIVDAAGIGGQGGSSFFSSSSGSSTGVGVGGTGGTGQGGVATLALATEIDAGSVQVAARGQGGAGGLHNVGGNGGDAGGGLAQMIVSGFNAGLFFMNLDASATGGNGAAGRDGNGGNGGSAVGGTASAVAEGTGGRFEARGIVFATAGRGGNGGAGGLAPFASITAAPDGGDGGNGTGGVVELFATDGGVISLTPGSSGPQTLGSNGFGGIGGQGANHFGDGRQSGDGGDAGAGSGGVVRLIADGGTITTTQAVTITAQGVTGSSGGGGTGFGGAANGVAGASAIASTGGRAVLESASGGLIALGDTIINADGDLAGRIELRTDASPSSRIGFTTLAASALGEAAPTGGNIEEALTGIFVAVDGGAITTTGDATLETGSAVGAHARSSGNFSAGGNLLIEAGERFDVRHDARSGTAATIGAAGDFTITAPQGIFATPGSLLGAGGDLTLSVTAGPIQVDALDSGNDIAITAAGAVSVEHAEAVNDFTASGASFRTGLNSIITGGDILITSPGAVDLGNSTAGGFVQVNGQSILFNSINAGSTVDLLATNAITGGTIAAGGDINLIGDSVGLTGAVTGDASFFAFGLGGAVAVNQVDVAGTISIFADGNLTGSYVAGGDVRLNSNANIDVSATANGGYIDANGVTTRGNLFAEAAGNVVLANSAAARMFGVSAGGSTTIAGGNAGEDLLVLAGTTASLNGITAGDDVDVRAGGDLTANGVNATGAGADTAFLSFVPGSGFTINSGEGISATDGSDVRLTAGGSIGASALSAGDDIFAATTGAIAINGATTLGLGATGGSSDIRTQGGDTTLSGLNAFTDILVTSTGTMNATGPIAAGRDVTITAATANLESLATPGGTIIDTVSAGNNLSITTSGDIIGGRVSAGGDLILTGASIDIVRARTTGTGQLTLTGTNGVNATNVQAGGATLLDASNGAVTSDGLASAGPVTATGDSIDLRTDGNIVFAVLDADVGDALVTSSSGSLTITSSVVAGRAALSSLGGGDIVIDQLAADVANATTQGEIIVNGALTARNIALQSNDITIASGARVGTAGSTEALSIENNDVFSQTFVGGTGTRNGFHLDANELTRLFGTNIEVFAPEVEAANNTSVGGSSPPDVIVDSFTLAGGAAGSNLGTNGALTIRTPGKMRVIGNVQLTGLSDTNALNLFADDALEVILGQGTVRLVNGSNAAGQLNMLSDDIIVATTAAINDVGAATTTDAIEARLAQNDGVLIDEGALFARGIRAEVIGGFYVQNSGSGTEFANRRGLTFGAGGLDVLTEGSGTRIVVNGVQIGPNGQVTGLDTVPLLTIAGSAPTAGGFDPRSTFNGCFIANPAACGVLPPPEPEFESNFPVQDVIEEAADAEDEDGNGQSLPVPLITMRDLDPLSGEPLLDDPVTGAGNDDLWTPTEQP